MFLRRPKEVRRLDLAEWLEIGIGRGWISEVVCSTHDLVPLTKEEAGFFEDGLDPCVPAVRVW
jgi:hypothetical protein